jgi:isopropylmalate/homocitrate/citramalate synthase
MAPTKRKPRVEIYDTTLRDGEQGHPGSFSLQKKYQMALEIDKLGVDVIEAGFPAVSKKEVELIKKLKGKVKAKICAISTTKLEHIQLAIESGADRIMIFAPCSESQMKAFRTNPQKVIQSSLAAINAARKAGREVEFLMMDAARAKPHFLTGFAKQLEKAGAQRLTLSDTNGNLTHEQTIEMFQRMKRNVRIPLSTHAHNDFGDADALTIAGIEGGATQAHVTVTGIGEKAGNACLEAVVMNLEKKHGIRTNVKKKLLVPQVKKIAKLGGFKIPLRSPVSGKLVHTYRVGLHMDDKTLAFRGFNPEEVGTEGIMVHGKGASGRITATLAKQLGYTPTREEVSHFVRHMKRYGERGYERPEAYIKKLIVRAERMRKYKANKMVRAKASGRTLAARSRKRIQAARRVR